MFFVVVVVNLISFLRAFVDRIGKERVGMMYVKNIPDKW